MCHLQFGLDLQRLSAHLEARPRRAGRQTLVGREVPGLNIEDFPANLQRPRRHADNVPIIEVLAERLEQLHKLYLEARQTVVTETLGTELRKCEKCERMMLPRRLWDLMDKSTRESVRKHATRAGSTRHCSTCVVYFHRSKTMDPALLERLRRDVGLIT